MEVFRKINWKKLGLVIKPNRTKFWEAKYCMLPTPLKLNNSGLFRIFYSTRNKNNQSIITFTDIDIKKKIKIRRQSELPSLQPGQLGCFDDNGVTPSCVIKIKNKIYLYYVGWKPRCTTRYSLVSGLAISKNGGKTFTRYSKAPILKNTDREPFSILTAPWVIKIKKKWMMWYVSGEVWLHSDLPRYNIKFAYSNNGLDWHQTGKVCIKIKKNERAIARPYVFYQNKKFHMIYSYETYKEKYRLGYARSNDGINWKRMDNLFNLKNSKNKWDSQMVEYGTIINFKKKTFLLYNGNNYGLKGIGIAEYINE